MQHRYRFAAACFLVGALPAFVAATDSEMTDDSLEETAAPAEFVLNQLATHRVVFFGESHWVADEVELVVRLVPQLPGIGTRTLAVEVFPASMQQQLDDVIAAETWNESDAVAVLRAAEMPHGEYLDIIQSVWALNHDGGESLALVAMGPGPNWRETLPPTDDYESFMVRRIENALEQRGGSVLAYLGLHHAFTRYVQPESTEDGRAWRFMVRTGNLLWWKMGEAVSAIGTHHPFQCRKDDSWAYCVPFDGAVDRAFADLGRGASGFAVAGSPFADLRFAPNVVYAAGYPDLRFVDFIDGWIWFAPIGQLRQTRIIPLEVYAPDEASLASVRKANPFDGGALTQEELESLWHDETEAHTKPILESRWKGVLNRHQ